MTLTVAALLAVCCVVFLSWVVYELGTIEEQRKAMRDHARRLAELTRIAEQKTRAYENGESLISSRRSHHPLERVESTNPIQHPNGNRLGGANQDGHLRGRAHDGR